MLAVDLRELFGRDLVYWDKERKMFSGFKNRKTLSYANVLIFPLTGIEFPLTDFPCACQTWESGESGFQENEFL